MNYLFPYVPALLFLGGVGLGISLDVRRALDPCGAFFLGFGTCLACAVSYALIYS